MRRILLVINPAAGNQDKKQALAYLTSMLSRQNLAHDLFWTKKESFQDGSLSDSLNKGYTDIFVLGGDGTVNQVINSMPNFYIPLALFPMGSGNDFARNFALPRDLAGQLEVALAEGFSRCDLFSCNGRLFANGVGIGFDGQVAEKMLSRKKRGEMAYLSIVLQTLLSYKSQNLILQSPDYQYEGKSFMLTVANGRYFGGFCLTPRALLNDSSLDVSLVKEAHIWKRPILLTSFKKGTHLSLPFIHYQQTQFLKVFSEQIYAHIDGEYAGRGNFIFENSGKTLKVKCASKTPSFY
jgi:diacylglycerol kinase (ATP)